MCLASAPTSAFSGKVWAVFRPKMRQHEEAFSAKVWAVFRPGMHQNQKLD
jgi:hypothetical protein